MWAQGHIWILELFDDSLVELLSHAVKFHDVHGVLLNPEFMEFVHQVA